MIKNFFANNYGYTPKEVDDLSIHDLVGFLRIEGYREEKSKTEEVKNKHLTRSKR